MDIPDLERFALPGAQRRASAGMLAIYDLTKSYGSTVALRRVSLRVQSGEIHALLGENGAGKSTLVKILSGVVRPDSGRMEIAGADFRPGTLMQARAAGVSTAFQELSLLPNLSVADNLMLPRLVRGFAGRGPVKANRQAAGAILDAFGAGDIAPAVLVEDLSLAQKQRIEIVRALSHRPRLLILDEPTAALAEPEWLFRELECVAAAGTAILYITHRLTEVRRLCSRATILQNGENIDTVELDSVSDGDIFAAMVGVTPTRHVLDKSPKKETAPAFALNVRNLTGANVSQIGLEVRKGEIVGVAALDGQGQRELFRMLGGATPIAGGIVEVNGRVVDQATPAEALRAGIAFLPEERNTEGVFLGLGVTTNISLSIVDRLQRFGIIDQARERGYVAGQAQQVDLAERFLGMPMAALSGGNQQKALLARVLLSGARILVLFDPTRGVDVGTKQVIYGVVRRFVAAGGSVLIYSTELEELVQLADRCLVMYRGCIVGEVAGDALSETRLVELASGQGNSDRAGLEPKSNRSLTTSLYYLSKNGTLVAAAVFFVLSLIYVARQPGALALSSVTDLFNNTLPLALAAAGGTLVVLIRNFDLSVAGVISLSNVLMATALGADQGAPLFALAMVVTVGLAVGAINGFLVAYVRLQSVTATLATMIICSGIALLILGTPGGNVPQSIADDLTGVIGGLVPVAALIAATVAFLWIALRRTNWGVALYAVGADEIAAELAGIATRRVKLLAYCLAGVLYGLAGYALSALTASGDPNSGNSFLFLVFSAIAIGGTAFTGGRGGLIGSMIGAAILTLLFKVLFSIGVLSFSTGIVQGLVMIFAVLLGAQAARVAPRRRA
ncbi:MAG TPA: ATP-binding cassette domain-containing protein [Burkholderiales bacterium]|jgi:ribose transport system ATP-binding protein|nr:ATP-binding cassette domain-containing protein [Burkholderiales bacterium]